MIRLSVLIQDYRKALIPAVVGALVGAGIGAVAGYFLGSVIVGAVLLGIVGLYATTSNVDWLTKADPRTRGAGSGGHGAP